MKHLTFARFLHLRAGVARIAAVLALSCLFSAALSAQNNPKISVQGTLKSANGATVADGPYTVTFNLYDVPTGGTVLWFEEATVEVLGGIYTHYLGANKPLVAGQFNKALYLGVKVNNYELVPRTEFSYAPYAFSVAAAQTVVCSGAVGDVKYSILNPTDFAKENGDCWVPMDGRSLAGSRLATHSSSYNQTHLPDAGGMFFRAQEFSNSPNNDPERTSSNPIAEIQSEALKGHEHEYGDSYPTRFDIVEEGTLGTPQTNPVSNTYYLTPYTNMEAASSLAWISRYDGDNGKDYTLQIWKYQEHRLTTTVGGSETRPKNLNLWVYIRIN
jgi:hypothetical protein